MRRKYGTKIKKINASEMNALYTFGTNSKEKVENKKQLRHK